MLDLGYFFAVAIVLAGILATLSIWSQRPLRLKLTALAIAGLFMPVAYLGFADLLGKPKPTVLELARADLEEATVVSNVIDEKVAIYVWLQFPDVTEPRAYVLPWSEEAARELHGARQEAEETGGDVRMRKPFSKSLDDREWMFYAPPQAALPPKAAPDEAPLVFLPPAGSS